MNRIENALPASHREMAGVPGTKLVRRRTTAVPARVEEAAGRTETTAPLPKAERAALAELQRNVARTHKLCFEAGAVEVTPDGRFRTMLTCPDSEWLDPRRNVFELGGRLPPALRQALEGTLRGAVGAWKVAPSSGDKPGLVLVSARAFPALERGAAPDRDALEAFGIAQVPSEPTARACLAACLDLATSGEVETPAGRKQFEDLREALEGPAPDAARRLQLARLDQDEDLESDIVKCLRTGQCRKLTAGEIALAMTVFGSDINYDIVRVYRHAYKSFLGLQPSNTLVAPDGSIYADEDGSVYAEDYSATGFTLQAAFIHEMTHVWQDQQGIDVFTRGIFERRYDYTIEAGKRFEDYLIEQQASIVKDYFRLLQGRTLEGKRPIEVYRKLLPFVPDKE